MKITRQHRKKLTFYLKEFYKRYPQEKFTVFHFVRNFKERLKNNKDAWCAVSGDTSVGKSLFVLMSMVLFGRPMTLKDNVAYIPKGNEIIEMFDKLIFQCLLIDEAAREMRAVNWQNKAQQNVNVRAMTDRFKNNWVFLNMPNFNEFTKSMRRGNLMFRIIIPYRTDLYARVIVQRKQRNWRAEDPWYDDLANKRYEAALKKYKELDNNVVLTIERGLPNTVMDFIIPNLELILPEITNEYERLKAESRKDEDLQTPQDKKDMYKDKYQELLEKVTKVLFYNKLDLGAVRVTKVDIAKSMGIDVSTFNKYLDKDTQTQLDQIKTIHTKQEE